MVKFKIGELCGAAYENAIKTIFDKVKAVFVSDTFDMTDNSLLQRLEEISNKFNSTFDVNGDLTN